MSEISCKEQRQDLVELGFKLYPGCRHEAVEYANEIGIQIDEIIHAFSDADILEAIHQSARVMGLLSSGVTCEICEVEILDEDQSMECENCGAFFCDDCGEYPGHDERYCSVRCVEETGKWEKLAGAWISIT